MAVARPERAPPHNLDAEASLLGAALLSSTAAEVLVADTVTADFYKPPHAHIADAIRRLVEAQTPVDAVTVGEELRRSGLLSELDGGAHYLLQLQNVTPAISGARRYAKIVHDTSTLRQLIYAATQIADLGYSNVGDPASAITAAAGLVEQLIDGSLVAVSGWDVANIAALLATDLEPEQASILHRSDGGALLYPAKMHVFQAEPSSGKAQPVDTPILTPSGWRLMGTLRPGETVIGSDGKPTGILAVHPQGIIDVYTVTLSDGSSTRCSARHLWTTYSHNDHERNGTGTTRTTLGVRDLLQRGKTRRDLFLPPNPIVEFATSEPLPVDPYLLGLLLGDGGLSKHSGVTFTSCDQELHDAIARLVPAPVRPSRIGRYGVQLSTPRGQPNPLLRSLQRLQLVGISTLDRFVPDRYLRAAPSDRLALLQGLLDTDGTVSGGVTFDTASPMLASAVIELVRGLGGRASSTTRATGYRRPDGERRECLPAFRVWIRLPRVIEPFRLTRQRARLLALPRRVSPARRQIVSVTPTTPADCRCITVAKADGIYLTENMIPTHNSWLALVAVVEILDLGGSAIYLDFEDTAGGIIRRLLALGATPDQLAARFDYRQIATKFGAAEKVELARSLDRLNPDLVVIDGVGEALTRQGFSEDKADDVNVWTDMLPRPIARTGAAVLMLDHVAKDPEQRGRWARGSGAKLAVVDGASYQIKVRTSFSRHRSGRVDMIVAKDRPGGVGAIGETAAQVSIDPHADGARVVIRLDPHAVDQAATDSWKPTVLMGRLFRALEDASMPLTAGGLLNLVHSDKASMKREALARLIAEGYLAEASGRPKTLRILRQYETGAGDSDRRNAPAWREPPPELFDNTDGNDGSEIDVDDPAYRAHLASFYDKPEF